MSSDVRFVMFFFGAFLIGLIAMIGKSVVDSNTSFANETAARLALARQYAAHRVTRGTAVLSTAPCTGLSVPTQNELVLRNNNVSRSDVLVACC